MDSRDRLRPIVQSIIFLGRQGMAFRGHRDDWPLFDETIDTENPVNKCNFKELLKYRIERVGDSKF